MISKNRYLQLFGLSIVVLGFIKMGFLSPNPTLPNKEIAVDTLAPEKSQDIMEPTPIESSSQESSLVRTQEKHPIYSVPHFKSTFPDDNDIQLISATKHGISPIEDIDSAHQNIEGLVYIGQNPYFDVDPLYASKPYLVPRAAVLLQDIGRAFYDSLYVKGIPLHHPIVTSVLRTKEHIKKLRRYNGNATENSCHLYGTTFDICYNRYQRVAAPDDTMAVTTRSDTLKWVLSEVLRDMRQNERCYVKYEVKQGCFHITTR